jgi:hypothetical protein
MRKYQNALLAGVAGLALIAGTGLASAQEQAKTHANAPKSEQLHAQTKMKEHAGATVQNKTGMTAQNKPGATAQNKTGATAQNEHKGMQPNSAKQNRLQENAKRNEHKGSPGAQLKPNNESAQKATPNNENAQNLNGKNGTKRSNQAANPSTNRGKMSAERQHTLRGLQGNASGQMGKNGTANPASVTVKTESGTNVRLSEQQRTHIRQTIIDARNAPRVGHVDFSVNVGTVIPRREIRTIHVVPVPEFLVRVEPRWRGLEYFIFRDEVVIVNPRDMRIVAIIPA